MRLPSKKDQRMGETRTANNGQEIKIVGYKNSSHIDVQFEDGTIVYNKTYRAYIQGHIRNPNYHNSIVHGKKRSKKDQRMGETRTANNGQKMTIIAYRNSNDIDVRFEDGTIVYKKTFTSFKKGSIANPNIVSVRSKKEERIGKESTSVCGQRMKVVEYTNNRNFKVQFEDGTIVNGSQFRLFEDGTMRNPNFSRARKERIGEVKVANNGQKMKIIEYRNHSDLDVEFEDGTIVKHRTYTCYIKGAIGNPNKRHISNSKYRVGEESVATNGMKMKIIAYRKACDIDIEFEDGTVIEHRTYNCFKGGSIAHPNIKKPRIAPSTAKTDRLGETITATNGMQMKIIAYRNAMDIDVEFEDGTIVASRTYSSFRNGTISNPNLRTSSLSANHSRVGETRVANCGMKMTIIAYRNSSDLDVCFEDGTIVDRKTYSNFKNGAIGNPIYQEKQIEAKREKYVGMLNVANNGQVMKIIAYHNTTNIDVEFQDGVIVRHRTLHNFMIGSIANTRIQGTGRGKSRHVNKQ